MTEDISFCTRKCDIMSCYRNKKHIKLPIPHSYADLYGTDECLRKDKKSERGERE